MTSWPPAWKCDVKSKIRLRHSKHISLKNITAKFQYDPIWNGDAENAELDNARPENAAPDQTEVLEQFTQLVMLVYRISLRMEK